MIISTAAEGISLSRKLETESAGLYEELAKVYPQGAATFTAYAKENKKNISNIESAYYSVITDAIEGCYAFNIETDEFTLDTQVPAAAGFGEVIQKAIRIEELIIKYYTLTAEQSKSLMADVPRVFKLVAKKREKRKSELEALLA
jgi:hypothetical protein